MNAELIIPKDIDADTLQKDNVIPFQLLPGAKDPTDNWLARLPQGTVFLCAPRPLQKGQLNVFLLEYHVVFKLERQTKLLENINEERYLWVDTRNFSRTFELATIIADQQQEEQQP